MATLLRMPELAANTPEALLTAWLVEENVRFSARTAIATVETAKAAVDIESEEDGVIAKFLVEAGADVEVGAPIALLAAPDEVVDIDSALAALGVAAAAAVPAVPEPDLAFEEASEAVEPVSSPASTASNGVAHSGSRIFASPLARRLAREAQIDVVEITGTGPGGRIVRADVERAIQAVPTAEPDTGLTQGGAVAHEGEKAPRVQSESTVADYVEIPHSRMRRAIAAGLLESKRTAPHFYLSGVADVGKLLKLRERINATSPVRVSVNDLVVLAVARAHTAVPRMNVTWTEGALRQYASVDVAVAISTEDGLLTPVVRGCDRMPISALAATTKDFAQRARAGQIKPAELSGGTITVSNLGMFGTVEFAAIINPPQAAILAVGAITDEVQWDDATSDRKKRRVRPARRMRVTLSVDHRPVDGAVAAEWMRSFVALLEDPIRILL